MQIFEKFCRTTVEFVNTEIRNYNILTESKFLRIPNLSPKYNILCEKKCNVLKSNLCILDCQDYFVKKLNFDVNMTSFG